MAKPLGTSVVVKQPWIEVWNSIETVGVRKVIPTKTVAGEITRSLTAVKSAVEQLGWGQIGRPFFRFHAIKMGVTYDIEIGYVIFGPLPQAPGLVPGKLPAGTYACLRYLGKNRGYQGNKALLDWIQSSGYQTDKWDSDLGDTFACRYEVYLSDIENEPDNKKWLKELAIKLSE
jgi:effector-binding domain-containing protein